MRSASKILYLIIYFCSCYKFLQLNAFTRYFDILVVIKLENDFRIEVIF